MRKLIIIIITVLFFSILSIIHANPISWPYLLADDYFRGTAGERLFFGIHGLKKGSLFINNDFRYYNFTSYWDDNYHKHEFDEYSRTINIFSLNYMLFERMQVSVRIPLVKVKNFNLSNSGLSDIFFGFSYRVTELIDDRLQISFSTGIKIPTGYYEYEEDKIPIGTGSFDVPIILNADLFFDDFIGSMDAGYIIIGNSKILHPQYDKNITIHNGDEFFIDLTVIRKLNDNIALKFESNYYDVFRSTYRGYDYDWGQSKLSIAPGIIFSTLTDKLKFDVGISYDITGKNTYSGFSPVLRIHYNIL